MRAHHAPCVRSRYKACSPANPRVLSFDAPSLVGKRFILFDPADWPSLYPFGCHHDLDRRSQLDLDDEAFNDAHFPNWKHARGKVVELSPGDCLYIPPYWWHHVQTLTTPCVSMAV